MRALLKRVARIALYCALALITLSIGLRIYSAWQIPRAKRLLQEFSQLRVNQPYNDLAKKIVGRYSFKPTPQERCEQSQCLDVDFGGIGGPEKWFVRQRWFADHGGDWLGFRPWFLNAHIEVRDGRVSQMYYMFNLQDRTYWGSSISAHSYTSLSHPSEASPEIDILNGFRNRDHLIFVQYSPDISQAGLAPVFDLDFSCIWRLRPCRTAWQVFPRLKGSEAKIEMAKKELERSKDPCPVQHMYSRVRDAQDVALATVERIDQSDDADEHLVFLNTKEFLKRNPAQNRVDRVDQGVNRFLPTSFDSRLFPDGPKIGSRVLLFSTSECRVVPASPENLIAAREAAAKQASPK